MKVKCAWCKEFFGTKEPYGGEHDKEVIDGICIQCLLSAFPDVYQSIYGNVPPNKINSKGVSGGEDIPRDSNQG